MFRIRSRCGRDSPTNLRNAPLISKRWLANEETNTYGGVYFWETKQHMQDWMDSQIFKDIGANPAFANAKVTDFEMIESLSAVTRGV